MADINQSNALDSLFALSGQIAQEGVSLVPRVVPADAPFVQFDHYPKGDTIAPGNQSRWFYHAHKPEQREPGEHGHFHLFLPLALFDGVTPLHAPPPKNAKGKKTAEVVHFAALSFDSDGLPLTWFTTNYWVTTEYLMPAAAIATRLRHFNMVDARGDRLVNDWLTAAVHTFHDPIIELLHQRDKALADAADDENIVYLNKSLEITSKMAFDL